MLNTADKRVLLSNTVAKRKGPSLCSARRSLLLTASSYHNYMQYLGNWTNCLSQTSGNGNISLGSVSTDLAHRPLPVGTLYDNTTVQGSWINRANMTADSNKFGRMVNNVSLAMPHSGVYAAATDHRNRILQPQDLDVCLSICFHGIILICLYRASENTFLKPQYLRPL